jgi:hypothetical protein
MTSPQAPAVPSPAPPAPLKVTQQPGHGGAPLYVFVCGSCGRQSATHEVGRFHCECGQWLVIEAPAAQSDKPAKAKK